MVDLEGYEIPDNVISAVPADIAKQYRVIPVMVSEFSITVAMADPTNLETLDSLRFILKTDIEGTICSPTVVNDAIKNYYGKSGDGDRKSVV